MKKKKKLKYRKEIAKEESWLRNRNGVTDWKNNKFILFK